MLATRFALVTALFLGSVAGQGIDLTVRGGSVPGPITWEVAGGTPFVQGGFIILSTSNGPSPLAPLDSRSLDVGLELLDIAVGGVFPADGRLVPPPLNVANIPALIDAAVYFQAISIPGPVGLIDQISPVRAMRFGPANAFHDRFLRMGVARSFFPVLPRPDGTFLLAGGGQGALFAQIATNQTDIYDPVTDTMTPGPNLAFERSLHTATRLNDGRWLLAGGVDQNNDPQVTAEIYDPVANTCTAVASMATPRMEHAASLLPNGKVLISGGMTDLNAPNSALDPIYSTTTSTEIYDPVANAWTAGPAMSKPRVGHAAIVRPDGRVQLIGGLSYYWLFVNLPSIEQTTEIYDSTVGAIGQFTAGSSLQVKRAGAALAPLGGGRWLLAGGVANISLSQQGTPTATAEIFDANTGQFTSTGSMAAARVFPVVMDLGGGRIALAGGGQGALFAATALDTTEIWNQATGNWSAGPTMVFPRLAGTGLNNPTGQFLLMGGESTVGVTNSTEFFYH